MHSPVSVVSGRESGQRHTGSIKLGSNLRLPLPAGWTKTAERLCKINAC